MITSPRRRCNERNCTQLALWGSKSDGSAHRCEIHHLPSDVDYVQRACVSCRLIWVLNAEGLCEDCSPEGRQIVHAKELAVKAWLDSDDFTGIVPAGISYVHDRAVEGGCSRRRPDFLYDCGGHVVCLEVDEHQHDSYQCFACDDGTVQIVGDEIRLRSTFFSATHACTCEWRRLMTIKQDLGEVQMRVVRFNPDSFTMAGATTKSRVSEGRRRAALLSSLRNTFARAFAPDDASITVQYVCYDGVNQSLVSALLRVVVCES